MKRYKILSLTDHRGHSKENSIYALIRAMSQHPRCNEIKVASRGLAANEPFFNDLDFEKIWAVEGNHQFQFDPTGHKFTSNLKEVNPTDYDIIFMRLPRPISDEFLIQLKQTFSSQVFVNDPLGIITASSKEFLLNFPELCPPILLCKSMKEVLDFREKHDIVLKPLREYGGKGLLKITGDTLNDGNEDHDLLTYLNSIENTLEEDGYLAMKYLKNVSQGDKRLIVVDGEILAASLRLPPKDSWLCNVAMGGSSVPAEATPRETEIVKTIYPLLQEKGILISGVDTLVDDDGERVLSEINTLSIGGFPQAQKQTGKPIIDITIKKIFQYADQQYQPGN